MSPWKGASVTRKFVAVSLAPWHVEWAVYAGLKRVEFNTGRAKDKPAYQNKKVLQSEPKANIAACLCELATSIHLNQMWNGPYWRNKYHKDAAVLPDVGRDIEVRRTRTVGGEIPVKYGDTVSNWLLVHGYVPDPPLDQIVTRALAGQEPANVDVTVWLLGQVRANIAWNNGHFVDGWDDDKKSCPARFLEAMPDVNDYDPEPPHYEELCRVE